MAPDRHPERVPLALTARPRNAGNRRPGVVAGGSSVWGILSAPCSRSGFRYAVPLTGQGFWPALPGRRTLGQFLVFQRDGIGQEHFYGQPARRAVRFSRTLRRLTSTSSAAMVMIPSRWPSHAGQIPD
jgi:hypothetical protein